MEPGPQVTGPGIGGKSRLADVANRSGRAFIYRGREETEERGEGEDRVHAEVDGRGFGFPRHRESGAATMALRPARSSCAPEDAFPRGGLAGVRNRCAEEPTCGSRPSPTQLEMRSKLQFHS